MGFLQRRNTTSSSTRRHYPAVCKSAVIYRSFMLLACCNSLAAGNLENIGVCKDATVISPGDHFTLTIECFTDSLVGSLHVNEAIDPLHYQFSTAFYCTLFNVSNVNTFPSTWVISGDRVMSETLNNLPSESHCTLIGCVRNPFFGLLYLIQNVSCTIPTSFPASSATSTTPISFLLPSLSPISPSPSHFHPPSSRLYQTSHREITDSSPSSLQHSLMATPSPTPSHNAAVTITLITAVITTSTVILILLCLTVTIFLYHNHSQKHKTYKVGKDNWKTEHLVMDYRPLNPINPISYSQETLVNTLLTEDTDCIQPSNTSSVHTPTYHISTDDSRTPGITGDFGDDTTNNTHLKSLFISEPGMMKKSASMYAVNTPLSYDSSGYNTGCSNSDTVLLQSPPSLTRTASETNCTRTLDLAITEAIHQPKEVCLLSQTSIQPLITQTSPPSSDTMSTVIGQGTQKELPSTLSSTSNQLIISTARIKNTLGPDNSTNTMSCSTQGSSANIDSHSTPNLPRHGHSSTTYDSSSTCNRTSLETKKSIHKGHSHLVERLTDQTFLDPSVIIIEHSNKNDVDKKMTTLQRCDGRVSGSHDSTTCDSIDTNCVVADTEMMIITTRATIGSPHHFNLGSPTTNTSSGTNSLMDYAGYLHIESPL